MTEVPVVIRVADRDDLEGVLAVHRAHNPSTRSTTSASELEVSTWKRMHATPGLSVYVAEIDHEPVGTGSLLIMPNLTYGCAPTAFIEAVVVVPGHRRRGIASQMLDTIVADASTTGCDKIQLLSHKRHATDGAHDLYRMAGFEAEAEGFRRYLLRRA